MKTLGIELRIESLYGMVDWPRAEGIVHVAAIASPANRIIALGPAAPRSIEDRFVLGLARARADALVTTGSILRAEPELVHTFSDDPEEQAALAKWRLHVLRKPNPPSVVVLSASGDFPIDHPALLAARSGFIWTSPKGQEKLRGTALPLPVEIEAPEVEASPSGLDAAMRRAQQKLYATTLLIEAGPSTALQLYAEASDGRLRADELLLSHFEGELDPEAIGPEFVPVDRREQLFGAPRSTSSVLEASGPWRFERMRSQSGA